MQDVLDMEPIVLVHNTKYCLKGTHFLLLLTIITRYNCLHKTANSLRGKRVRGPLKRVPREKS